MGADDVHPESAERGAVLVSVSLYPVTPIVSVAVNDEMETVRDDEVDGMVKEVMEGGVVSDAAGFGSIIRTIELYGAIVAVPTYLVPATSIMGSSRLMTLDEVLAL